MDHILKLCSEPRLCIKYYLLIMLLNFRIHIYEINMLYIILNIFIFFLQSAEVIEQLNEIGHLRELLRPYKVS